MIAVIKAGILDSAFNCIHVYLRSQGVGVELTVNCGELLLIGWAGRRLILSGDFIIPHEIRGGFLTVVNIFSRPGKIKVVKFSSL